MEPNCIDITKRILPAVRASVAEVMKEKYSYTEMAIAEKLGVVQVTVSKYLNRRYSKEVNDVKSYILEHNLNTGIIDMIKSGMDSKMVCTKIDELCAAIATS